MPNSKTKVAVIGSGFGGLAAAIRLQTAGCDVEVFEKRAIPGGRSGYYKENGYTFDAGPTVITAPHVLHELFEGAGKQLSDYVTLKSVSPLYRLHWEDGTKFDYTDDLESTLRQIADLSLKDAENYPRFLDYSRQVFEAGYTKLAHVPFLDWASMIKCSPTLARLRAHQSVYKAVSRYIEHPKLREAFSFHSLLVGGNPFTASSIYTLIHYLERKWGVYYAEGGMSALVAGLVSLFQDLGGKIHYGAEIKKIETGQGRVSGIAVKNGGRFSFDVVVSNADVVRTYTHLLKDETAVARESRRLSRAHYSMSLFLVYFGVKKRYETLSHHNVFFGRRYKGLLDDIFSKGKVADDFSLYVHAPAQHDESIAPKGGDAMYALSPVPHLGKFRGDWKTLGPEYADRILSYLESHYMPGLRDQIEVQRIFTPEDFDTELGAHLGSAFSLEPRLTQSAYFRVHNRERHLGGLYFAGAGTHTGAGIPGVINSAKATSGLVLADLQKKRTSVAVEIPDEVLTHCRDMISVGSKSFSMAARLFEPQTRHAAFFLYGWCRYCDDQIDKPVNRRLQEERVEDLMRQTQEAFVDEKTWRPEFTALAYIAKKYSIPRHYALELIEGMRMDVRKERFETISELELYCYRVAGTVGLMMSHVMGVSDEAALKHASDLGSAMQLTNIARDVLEDAQMGRVYLPLHWLDEVAVPEGEITHQRNREAVFQVVKRMLAHADNLYLSGNSGLKYLPLRAAIAVAVASCVYRSIGSKVLRLGSHAWDERTITTKWEKVGALVKGIGLALSTVPFRLFSPWHRAPITNVWRCAHE